MEGPTGDDFGVSECVSGSNSRCEYASESSSSGLIRLGARRVPANFFRPTLFLGLSQDGEQFVF